MKKLLFLSAMIFACGNACAWEVTGFPAWYSYGRDPGSNINFLPGHLNYLRDKYGIETYINRDPGRGRVPDMPAAMHYLDGITKTADSKIIAIWINGYTKTAGIAMTENLKQVFPAEYVEALRADVLNNLLGKWYIGDSRVLTKVMGGFFYILEKGKLSEEALLSYEPYIIRVDDPLYRLGLSPVLNDIIRLFYAEPVSFVLYFPLVTYFLFVRFLGMRFGRTGYTVSTLAWLALMALTAALIVNRVYIYAPEYWRIFMLYIGMTAPMYVYLMFFYGDRIGSAAYNYVQYITGGAASANAFEGKKWGE